MKNGFLFGVFPYLAFLLCAGGLTLRLAFVKKQSGSMNSEFGKGQELFGNCRLCTVSLGLLLVGHLAGLLFPQQILLWNTVPLRLYALEACSLAAGAAGLIGCCGSIWRQLGKTDGTVPRQIGDTAFLSFLFAAISSGILMAVFYRWASSWGALTLTPYVRSLFIADPATSLAAGMPLVVQVHVVSSLSVLAAFPYTRLALPLMRGIRYGAELFLRPIFLLTRPARMVLESAVEKYNPAMRIWPEEE